MNWISLVVPHTRTAHWVCPSMAVPVLLCCSYIRPAPALHPRRLLWTGHSFEPWIHTHCTADSECAPLRGITLGGSVLWFEACPPSVLFFPRAHLVLLPMSCETSIFWVFPISVQSQHLWIFFLMPILKGYNYIHIKDKTNNQENSALRYCKDFSISVRMFQWTVD